MKRPRLWRLSVTTSPEAEDAVAEMLASLLGAPASSYFDLERQTSIVSIYLPKATPSPLRREIKNALERLAACGLDAGAHTVKCQHIRHQDWAESWKRHFKPLEIGKSLLIKPSWSQRPAKDNQDVVILDPGLSFGTGQHPTTSFCLAEVARHVDFSSPRSFLDIGTGSGILAIAAAKLRYHPVTAFDFDPESVRIARANAVTNHVSRKIQLTQNEVRRLSLRPARRFDLVCANLISTLLIAERKRIASQLNQGGTLVLAGILKTEFAEVQHVYEERGLVLTRTIACKEWQSGAFRLPKKV
jgi:ribosomal protein L11 methyltransferase